MKLVDIHAIRPSAYNPRKADPERLALVRLSLQKLGFLLPIYATRAGEIISGHQRHHIALAMGARRVPVEYLPKPLDLAQCRALNIVFNRATNDLDRDDDTVTITRKLALADVRRLARDLPDVVPDSPEFFACLPLVRVPIRPLLKANVGRWVQYARNVSRTLQFRGIVMPIVLDPAGRVVNGIGRLQVAAEQKETTVTAVRISAAAGEFARAVLNYLSMDFNIEERYADVLRYNSFRRAVTFRPGLGKGFYAAHFGGVTTKRFSLKHAPTLARWRRCYGTRVLDFGAGRFTDTALLRSAGIECTPFEPYPLDRNEINPDRSRLLARDFLAAVATGATWDTIFVSSVLNSVPFLSDRRKIVAICAALCSPATRLHVWAMSTNQTNLRTLREQHLNQRMALGIQFKLNYEPNIILGGFGSKPKVQKFHTAPELRALLRPNFGDVRLRLVDDSFICVCAGPRWTRAELAGAVAFEFDLPYPDGTRMGLAGEARAAFGKRLGVKL